MARQPAAEDLPEGIALSDVVRRFVDDRRARIEKAVGVRFEYDAKRERKLPPVPLGCGALGCAYAIEGDQPMALKITADIDEGEMWQRFWSLQKQGKRLEGLPYIERVFRLKTNFPLLATWQIYGIVRERVGSREDVRRALGGWDFNEFSEHWRGFRPVAYSYYSAVEDENEDATDLFRDQLENIAAEIVEMGGIAQPLGDTLMQLTQLDIPPVDTHLGNIGLRDRPFVEPDGKKRPPAIVFIDPGVTPRGGEEPAELLVANRRRLHPNPFVQAVCGCGTMPAEPIEELNMSENGSMEENSIRLSAADPDPAKPFFVVVTPMSGAKKVRAQASTYGEAIEKAKRLAQSSDVVKVDIVQSARLGASARDVIDELAGAFEPTQPPSWRSQPGELVVNPIRLTQKEVERADAGYTIIVRPQAGGGYWVAAIEVATGTSPGKWAEEYVDDQSGIPAATTEVARMLSKMGQGGAMAEAARYRGMRSNSAARDEMAKKFMRRRMATEFYDYFNPETGYVDVRKLAEDAATAVGEQHWIDDPNHPVWSWARDIGTDKSGMVPAEEEELRRGRWEAPEQYRNARPYDRDAVRALQITAPALYRATLKSIMYDRAIAEGATEAEAKEVSREPWRWLNEYGEMLPLSEAPRVQEPSWWPGRSLTANARCPVGTEVQTLIFSKDDFTQKQAKAWAKKNDYKYGKVDEKEDCVRRIRRTSPRPASARSRWTMA